MRMIDKMAPMKVGQANRGRMLSKYTCKHCEKSVVAYVRCKLCAETFHKSCLEQAAGLQKATCKHVAEDNQEVMSPKPAEKVPEIDYLLKIIKEMEEKNTLLAENCNLWRQRAISLEKELEQINNATHKKGKQSKSAPHPKVNNCADSKEDVTDDRLEAGDTVEGTYNDDKAPSQEATNLTPQQQTSGSAPSEIPEGEFVEFQTRKQKRQGRQILQKENELKNQTKPRRDIKIGTNEENNSFLAANHPKKDKKIWLSLSKINEKVTEDIIVAYISGKLNSTAADIYVKVCSPKNPTSKRRFMVGVKPEFKDIVYQPDFWPAGVAFERFNFGLGRNFLDRA